MAFSLLRDYTAGIALVAAVAAAFAIGRYNSLRASGVQSTAPPPQEPVAATTPRIFTPDELAAFTKKGPIYIAIIGDVYDVTTGRKHYGVGNSYEHFAGCDATAAYATGESEGEGLTDSVDGLDLEQLKSIAGWHKFYAEHETYTHVGVLVGRYYDEQGRSREVFPWARIQEQETRAAVVKRSLPDCNSRWSQESGSEVWCTLRSGGIERAWVGVPRLYKPALDPAWEGGASGNERCACASDEQLSQPFLEAYPGCDASAERCFLGKKM